ncbi:DMT family transporter [Bacillus sp. XF8]|uniref:DMT family transporter n=1 Tax=Bacillus sp. XF8 TaxID=2819289 RepID=UPI001AA0516A|nr:DMT family transporter [Bacillus sp. XF8]MBO1582031.1 DMT family transporter [Bacillus sp. XF8]
MMNGLGNSIKNNQIGIVLILIASFSTAVGQLLWKLSNGHINLYFLIGFFMYFVGAALMIVAFRFGSLSVLHPLLSMGYVFALFLGTFFLGESLTYQHILGTILIVIGAVLIGGSDTES